MHTAQVAEFLATTKGAPLSCIFALLALNRPVSVNELATLTHYGRHATGRALSTLELHGLATQQSRYTGWILTDKTARQLELPFVEGAKSSLAPRSSSSSYSSTEGDPFEDEKLQLQQTARAQKAPSPPSGGPKPEITRIAERLVQLAGCPRKRAFAAIAAAIEDGGSSPHYVELELLRWSTYCDSPLADSIQNAGVFIASKLENDERCPVFRHRADEYGSKRGEAWSRWLVANDDILSEIDRMEESNESP